jgi:hypothetical protein
MKTCLQWNAPGSRLSAIAALVGAMADSPLVPDFVLHNVAASNREAQIRAHFAKRTQFPYVQPLVITLLNAMIKAPVKPRSCHIAPSRNGSKRVKVIFSANQLDHKPG